MENEQNELPVNIEAEHALLGVMLTEQSIIPKVRDLVCSEDFHIGVHGRIFDTILEVTDSGRLAAPLVLKAQFDADPDLENCSGYLQELAASAVSILGAPDYARVIRDMAQRRRLIFTCEDVIDSARNPQVDQPAAEIAALATAEWQAIVEQGNSLGLRSYRDVAITVVEDLSRPSVIYPTGIPELDKAMDGGLHPGKAYGFAARKKVGKTVLAATISGALNLSGVKHLFIAGEMGAEQIVQRQMAHSVGVYASSFTSPKTREDIGFLTKVANHATSSPESALYADAPGLTLKKLRQIVSVAVGSHGVKGVIIDYLQLVGGQTKGENQAQHLDRVAQWVADIGRQLGLWFVVMAQVNQDDNVRGGEGMRLAFDQVYRLHRDPGGHNENEAWLEMIESRYTAWQNVGSEGRPGLLFNERGPMFEPAMRYETHADWQRDKADRISGERKWDHLGTADLLEAARKRIEDLGGV